MYLHDREFMYVEQDIVMQKENICSIITGVYGRYQLVSYFINNAPPHCDILFTHTNKTYTDVGGQNYTWVCGCMYGLLCTLFIFLSRTHTHTHTHSLSLSLSSLPSVWGPVYIQDGTGVSRESTVVGTITVRVPQNCNMTGMEWG